MLLALLSACTGSIPTPDDDVFLPGLDTAVPAANGLSKPTEKPSAAPGEAPSGPTPTPHDNYRKPWDEAGGIPEGVPQLAWGVSEVSYLNQRSVLLRWSIINEADINSVCGLVEDWTGRPMQYSEGADSRGLPKRVWKNDNEHFFLQLTIFERDEPYEEDGSILRGEFMISPLH